MSFLAVVAPAPAPDTDGSQLLARCEGIDQTHCSIRILSCNKARTLSPPPDVEFQIAALDGPLQLSRDGEPDRHLHRLQTASISVHDVLATAADAGTRILCLSLHTAQDGQLLLRPILDHMMLPASNARWFVHAVAGSVKLSTGDEHLDLEMNQSAWLTTTPAQRALIEGGGELALVQLPA